MKLYDAHNHLQDDRFGGRQASLVAACRTAGVAGMVVNGSSEADWAAVERLARTYPDFVRPSFGYHPWYVGECSPGWRDALEAFLQRTPGAAVGEIGLDRWKADLDFDAQQRVFDDQLTLAAERDLPVSIHCLRAWGALFDRLRAGPRPARGFLLHSYGGPVEMVKPLAALGAYFSLPGFFAHARKHRQRETFRHVPRERLLIETDAPDQPLPREWRRHPSLPAEADEELNHPANLAAVYDFAAHLLNWSPEEMAAQIEANFLRLFGPAASSDPSDAGSPPAPA